MNVPPDMAKDMTDEPLFNAGQYRFSALVPALDNTFDLVQRDIAGQSLLSRALETLMSAGLVDSITIAVSDIEKNRNMDLPAWVELLEIKKSSGENDLLFAEDIKLIWRALCEDRNISIVNREYDGVIVIDPLCPLLRAEHLEGAVETYLLQTGMPRPWTMVTGASLLPNHYHPRKIVKIDEKGTLKYYDSSGEGIYQRQQLKNNDYYTSNSAVQIIDPMAGGEYFSDTVESLLYIVDESMITIRGSSDFDLANEYIGTKEERYNDRKQCP